MLRHGYRTRRLAAVLPLALLVLTLAAVMGCANAVSGTPAGTSQITVTATSGGVTHSTNLTLTVQ